ncbi:hypothetical protein LDENG_00237390 [Lucifuga dentata]|nr:hypothetical protein LDENG_00237390 [Lucifuga dentata]
MFFHYVVVVLSLLNFQRGFHVSSCADNCEDKPVFIPPKLVVRHGEPTSALCVGCKMLCQNKTFGLEKSLGTITPNGTTIKWEVDKMMEWNPSPTCYSTFIEENQCCSKLAVIVYQPPHKVSISFINHSGPMFEGHLYTLRCTVQDVAPVKNLIVTFYRGSKLVGSPQSTNNTEKTPLTESFTLNINTTKEDDGVLYICEATLDLKADGLTPKDLMWSKSLISTVYYGPKREQPPHPNLITVTAGDPLSLNCSAIGNPAPSYTWTLPSSRPPPPSNSSVLTINSVDFGDEGQYICVVSNMQGNITEKFHVDVQVNYVPIIIGVAVGAAVFIIFILSMFYIQHYRHNRMGQYNLKDVFHLRKRHVSVPTATD